MTHVTEFGPGRASHVLLGLTGLLAVLASPGCGDAGHAPADAGADGATQREMGPSPDSGAEPDAGERDASADMGACAPENILESSDIVLSVGHVDAVAIDYDACRGALTLAVDDNTEPLGNIHVLREPEHVLLHGSDDARIELPDVASLAFLGAPGDMVWLLPEQQLEAVVWPGLQSYGVEVGEVEGDGVALRLVDVEGPGAFYAFYSPQDEVTPVPLLFDPAADLDEFTVPAGTHLHLNWAFVTPGLYRLTFQATVTLADGTEVTSTPHTYRFLLGELSTLPSTEATVLVVDGLEPVYPVGVMLALTASRYGATSTLPLAWSRRCYGPDSSEPLPWEPLSEGEALSTPARSDCQYRAQLMSGGVPVATSQAVSPYVEG